MLLQLLYKFSISGLLHYTLTEWFVSTVASIFSVNLEDRFLIRFKAQGGLALSENPQFASAEERGTTIGTSGSL